MQQQTEHNQMLLEKLIDDKIAKPVELPISVPSNLEPVQSRRPSWGKIRQDYETKQRAAYWQQRIADQEALDAEKQTQQANAKEGQK